MAARATARASAHTMARESNLSAVETEAATSALYRIEKQMNETWVDPRAELEDLEVKEEL